MNPLSLDLRSEWAARRLAEAIEDVWVFEFEAHHRYHRHWNGKPLEPYWYLPPDDSDADDAAWEDEQAARDAALDYDVSRESARAAYGRWRV